MPIKMKQSNPIFTILLFIGAVDVILFLVFFAFNRVDVVDKIRIISNLYPLNEQSIYQIKKNVAWRADDRTVFPADVFYLLVPINYQEEERMASDFIEGRKIGTSHIDLDSYLDIPVVVDGKYYYGPPILMTTLSQPESNYVQNQVVVNIEAVKMIESTN